MSPPRGGSLRDVARDYSRGQNYVNGGQVMRFPYILFLILGEKDNGDKVVALRSIVQKLLKKPVEC